MTDKDPKDMTASELLRWAALDERDEFMNITPQGKLLSALAGKDYVYTDTDQRRETFRSLAAKIDAELAEARKEAVNESKKPMWWFRSAIKRGEDWPEPRDGEKFRDYLHRCFLPRPRFEDGEPVSVSEYEDILCYSVHDNGSFMLATPNESIEYDAGERVKRPAPEALGADGLPIVDGETVWLLSGTVPHTVDTVYTDVPTPDGRDCPWVDIDNDGTWACAESLTHTPPDTQERIDGDVHKDECEYFDHVGDCRGCPANGTGESCIEAMTRDLLRRQRELDKRTGGAE